MVDLVPIQRNTKISELDALLDQRILMNCFVDNGLLESLKDCCDSSSIILGRTGAGKTALLLKLESEADYVTTLDPFAVSFNYIENSNIIKFLDGIGVNLDIFYKYLWRHILTIEFLKLKYPENKKKNLLGNLIDDLKIRMKSSQERSVVEYLQKWTDKFWLETDVRLKEIVDQFESTISSDIKSSIGGLELGVNGAKKIGEEKRAEVVERATKIVNDLQMKELSRVLSFLNDYVFNDDQKKYFILIDQLDENWTINNIKYRLVRSLVEEVKHFRKIQNTKVILAMRVDLFMSVLDKTRDSGFQEDKIESLIFRIKWTDDELKKLVDKRISFIYKSKYTKDDICFNDLFPEKDRKRGDPWSYLLQRTFRRPRDILQFVNYCFENSIDKTKIGWGSIFKAEKEYSIARLNSIYEEWSDIYPSLKYTKSMILDKTNEFELYQLKSQNMEDWLTKLYEVIIKEKIHDSVANSIISYWDEQKINLDDVVVSLLSCFYRVGLVGISTSELRQYEWSFKDRPFLSEFELSQTRWIKIHKMFYSAFHINDETTY